MTGIGKFIRKGGLMPSPPRNLWEVLTRGAADTYPLHTALWLFKHAQGSTGPFRHLPGPEFGYRVRDGKPHSTDANNAGLTPHALS